MGHSLCIRATTLQALRLLLWLHSTNDYWVSAGCQGGALPSTSWCSIEAVHASVAAEFYLQMIQRHLPRTAVWNSKVYNCVVEMSRQSSGNLFSDPSNSRIEAGPAKGPSKRTDCKSRVPQWYCLFAKSLCDPIDCSMPGFPVLHCLLEFAQTHVHSLSDTIQPSHSLPPTSPPAINLFQWVGSLHQAGKVWELQ